MKIFYDGDCYFCRNYVAYASLRSSVGEVQLISLRSDDPACDEIRQRGFKVNYGFIVEHDGNWLEGDAAFSYLNSLMPGHTMDQRILKSLSKGEFVNWMVYKFLVLGRFAVLAIQGLPLIDMKPSDNPSRILRYSWVNRLVRLSLWLSLPILYIAVAIHLLNQSNLHAAYAICIAIAMSRFAVWASENEWNVDLLLKRLSQGKRGSFIIYFLAALLVVNAVEPLVLRRFLGFFLTSPVWGLLGLYAQRYSRRVQTFKWIAFVPVITLLFAAIPGVIIGPFYGGIAGWVIEADEDDPVKIRGYKLVNDNGKKAWLPDALLQPHGQIGRFRKAFVRPDTHGEEDFMAFFLLAYERAFDGFVNGRFPHQWALGDWAYPTHSMQNYQTEHFVAEFHPQRIKRLERITDVYDINGNFKDSKVHYGFDTMALRLNLNYSSLNFKNNK